jgi:hypothetical protein
MASVEIRIYTRGLDGFKRAPAGNIVHNTGKRLCVRIARRVLEEALITVPRDNGQLADSGEVVDRPNGSAVQFSADYARYVHGPGDGSGRGQRTEPHWPPWDQGPRLTRGRIVMVSPRSLLHVTSRDMVHRMCRFLPMRAAALLPARCRSTSGKPSEKYGQRSAQDRTENESPIPAHFDQRRAVASRYARSRSMESRLSVALWVPASC